jgi:hypothetical protein
MHRRRKAKPETIRSMAARRGLSIHKAKRGGWYVMLTGMPWGGVLYCTHEWTKVKPFVLSMPILESRGGSQ